MSKNTKKESANGAFGKPESLQAIVFADDFTNNLTPVQRVYPAILLPVVTAPLLDYLLEMLIRSGVQQVFLYCSSHVEALKAYLDSLKNSLDDSIIVTPIFSEGCRSLGDAMRDIDTKGCIRGDFILIRGTAFANVDLKSLMDLHRAKKEKDKNTAMTMLFKNLGSVKDSSLKFESSLVVSNANTKKLLHYKKFTPAEKKIELDLQWFLEQDKVNIHTALFDTRIYLCSQSVLPLFADNFDFQTMEDLIRGVLINEEFLDSRIYWEHLISPSYAQPITSWKAYQILCTDILQRQSYPLVPNTSPLSLRNFIYMSRSTYKHQTSIISKHCTLHSESIIGKNSILGENSFVKKSVIGPRCKIGKNVKINSSFIISDVVIEDNCDVSDSIIFSNCTIQKDTKLDSCILLPNVQCTENFSNTFIEVDANGKLVPKQMEKRGSDFNFSASFADGDHTVDEDDDDDDDDASSSSLSSAWSDRSLSDSAQPPQLQDDNELFLSEVIDSLLRGYQDKLKCENLILEINSSRYAYNVNIQQVSYNVIKGILNLPIVEYNTSESKTTQSSKTQANEYHKSLKMMLVFFKPIIDNYIKTKIAQEDCLRAIQDVVCTNQELLIPCIQNILHFFYDNDILDEEKIIDWYERGCNSIGETNHCSDDDNEDDDHSKQEGEQNVAKARAAIRTALSPFIKWLREAEEDSSDSE